MESQMLTVRQEYNPETKEKKVLLVGEWPKVLWMSLDFLTVPQVLLSFKFANRSAEYQVVSVEDGVIIAEREG